VDQIISLADENIRLSNEQVQRGALLPVDTGLALRGAGHTSQGPGLSFYVSAARQLLCEVWRLLFALFWPVMIVLTVLCASRTDAHHR
jgi:hypothetical protein